MEGKYREIDRWQIEINQDSEGYFSFKCSLKGKDGDSLELRSFLTYTSELEVIEGIRKAIQIMSKRPIFNWIDIRDR